MRRAGGRRIGEIEIHRDFSRAPLEDSVLPIVAAGQGAVMCGDLMHSPVRCLHPEWVPWADWDAELASRTRRAFLERYCDTPTLICSAHFPLPSAGRVVRAGNAFRFVYDEKPWS